MTGERFSTSYEAPNRQNSNNADSSPYPPFDPVKAEALKEEARRAMAATQEAPAPIHPVEQPGQPGQPERAVSGHDERSSHISFDPILYESESAWRAANPTVEYQQIHQNEPAYDFYNVSRFQEETFLLAAANATKDNDDFGRRFRLAEEISKTARENNASIYNTMKSFLGRESRGQAPEGKKDKDYTLDDLSGSFVDITCAYVANRDKYRARGLAKALITNMQMTVDMSQNAFRNRSQPNPYLDEIRTDLSLVEDTLNDYIDRYDPHRYGNNGDSNDLKGYLQDVLARKQTSIRLSEERGVPASANALREAQAFASTIKRLSMMQEFLDDNLSSLHGTATAYQRPIE